MIPNDISLPLLHYNSILFRETSYNLWQRTQKPSPGHKSGNKKYMRFNPRLSHTPQVLAIFGGEG